MRTDVCTVEWDGDQRLGVTIDIYRLIFIIDEFHPRTLVLWRSFQWWRLGWCRPDSLNFEPRPDLVKLAERRTLEYWALWEAALGRPIRSIPARLLFYNQTQETFDRLEDITLTMAGLVKAFDMNAHLNRRT